MLFQNPKPFKNPEEITGNTFEVNLKLNPPFIISIRICSEMNLSKIKNVRLNKVNKNEIYIFWMDQFNESRCVQTYQVYFKSTVTGSSWLEITKNKHVPFLNHFFHDLDGVSGEFSELSIMKEQK